MKTAVSIPDDVFEKVEGLARRLKRSRSAVYGSALKEYLARHAPSEITEAMNRVCETVNESGRPDPFLLAAGRRVLSKSDW